MVPARAVGSGPRATTEGKATVNEIIAAAIGVPLTFVLGWWGRGKWERYPWNAKPKRWSLPPESTSAADLRAEPVGQFEQRVAERTAIWAEAWKSAFDLALKAAEDDERPQQ